MQYGVKLILKATSQHTCPHNLTTPLLPLSQKVWSDFDRASSLICGNKTPTRCNRWYLLQILLHAQHVSDNTMPIIRSSRVLYGWSLPVVFGALVFKLSVWCGAEGYVSTGSDHPYNNLELLMMGIMVPETCWASNKICNKYYLLHLVGILFPHNVVTLLAVTMFTNSHSLLLRQHTVNQSSLVNSERPTAVSLNRTLSLTYCS